LLLSRLALESPQSCWSCEGSRVLGRRARSACVVQEPSSGTEEGHAEIGTLLLIFLLFSKGVFDWKTAENTQHVAVDTSSAGGELRRKPN
jgi:hypothetical protein